MADLKHIKTFESFSIVETEEVTEGIIGDTFNKVKDKVTDAVGGIPKNEISNFLAKEHNLENPSTDDVSKLDNILKTAFAKAFAKSAKVKKSVLDLSFEEKMTILKKADNKLSNPKIGSLSIWYKNNTWEVGGVATGTHTRG